MTYLLPTAYVLSASLAAFYVDVGDTVNTPDTIDAGELRANIFIKPVRSVRFISLNFIATRTSANFSELEL